MSQLQIAENIATLRKDKGGTQETITDAVLRIKAAFASAPAEGAFDLAYQLCHALHEGAISLGYKRRLPWQAKDRDDDSFKAWTAEWGYSACCEPEGASIMKRGTAFFSSAAHMPPISAADVRSIRLTLEPLTHEDTIKAVYALYQLTAASATHYATLDEIAHAAGLTPQQVAATLENIPAKLEGNGYRLAGSYMLIPTILTLLIQPQ